MQLRPFGATGVRVTPIGLGGFPFGGVNRAAGWDPFTPDGRKVAVATIHRAVERGINYIDTAASYGDGNSEDIIGEALSSGGRRHRVVLATKCPWNVGAEKVTASAEASLRRLRTDVIDVLQFHGGRFTPENAHHIVEGGPLGALTGLRAQGKVRFLGFTCEEPWTARPLIASGVFDVVQLRYNLIHQGAALHALDEAREKQLGVAVMRPMTSGILQRTLRILKPEWAEDDIYEVALKYVLSDSRVHVANVGMRWPGEVDRNVDLVESFVSTLDVATLPRLTAGIYKEADEAAHQ